MDCLSDDSDSQRHLRAGSISDACPSRQYWDYNEITPPPSPLSLVEEAMVSIAKVPFGYGENAITEMDRINEEKFQLIYSRIDSEIDHFNRDHASRGLARRVGATDIKHFAIVMQRMFGRYKHDFSRFEKELSGLAKSMAVRDVSTRDEEYYRDVRFRQRILTYSEQAKCDLSSSARMAIFLALSKLQCAQRSALESTASPWKPSSNGVTERDYITMETFRGRTPEFFPVLEDAIGGYEKRTLLYDEQRFKEYLEGDYVARAFCTRKSLWADFVEAAYYSKRGLAIRTVSKGLAILMRPLLTCYAEKKKVLRAVFQDTDLCFDYDILREAGVNARLTETFRDLAPDEKAKAAEALDFLEATAPGLLILLRPDLLQVAFTEEYSLLDDDNALVHPQTMDIENRSHFIALLDEQSDNGADDRRVHIELFKILCGEDNGPWSRNLKDGRTFSQHHASGFLLCRVAMDMEQKSTERQGMVWYGEWRRYFKLSDSLPVQDSEGPTSTGSEPIDSDSD